MSTSGRRLALLVANSKYSDPKLGHLDSPVSDAERLRKQLESDACGNFEVIPAYDFSPDDAKDEIQAFFFDNANKNDLLLFFYSGHGLRENGELYFAFKDTKKTVPDSRSISAKYLTSRINDSHAEKIVTILDCCFAGLIADGRSKGAAGLYKSDFPMEAKGRYTLFAAGSTQEAKEKDGVSVYSRHLIDALNFSGDLSDEPTLTANSLHQYLRNNVRLERAGHLPDMTTSGTDNEIVLARNPNAQDDKAESTFEPPFRSGSPVAEPIEAKFLESPLPSRSGKLPMWRDPVFLAASLGPVAVVLAAVSFFGESGDGEWTKPQSTSQAEQKIEGLVISTQGNSNTWAKTWILAATRKQQSGTEQIDYVRVAPDQLSERSVFSGIAGGTREAYPILCISRSASEDFLALTSAYSYVARPVDWTPEGFDRACNLDLGRSYRAARADDITAEIEGRVFERSKNRGMLINPSNSFTTTGDYSNRFFVIDVEEENQRR